MTDTCRRWDDLPPDWSVTMQPATETHYFPLVRALQASVVWRNLTKPQRELLLSCYANAPIKARIDVITRLVQRGLILADGPRLTDAGREIIVWGRP